MNDRMFSAKSVFESEVGTRLAIKAYYESRESRMGYELVFGGTQHFGYYTPGTLSPFPIGKSLRRYVLLRGLMVMIKEWLPFANFLSSMEEKLMGFLALPTGSRILDAGCGVGHVALYLAKHGMRVTGVDIIDHHVETARRNVYDARLPKDQVVIEKMDFEHLERIPSESHDGAFTMQSLGHAFNAERAAAGFFRILKPGGRFALIEVERRRDLDAEGQNPKLTEQLSMINVGTGMPTNERSHEGFYKELLENAGFVDIEVYDISNNILPVVRMFYFLLLLPYIFVRLFRLEKYFISMLAGTTGYVGYDRWRFIAVTATKPKKNTGI
jgi:ubiquinone/menaquinone biosynthesis C-methylase UbiE